MIALARATWGSPPGLAPYEQRPPKPEVAPILADALQDAGCEHALFLDMLRHSYYHMPSISEFRWLAYWDAGEETACREADRRRYRELHEAATAPAVVWLSGRIATLRANGQRKGIAELERRLLALGFRHGYVQVYVHDLRGTPPPGHIWIRLPYSKGGWHRSRREKPGRPLTYPELEQLVETLKETADDDDAPLAAGAGESIRL